MSGGPIVSPKSINKDKALLTVKDTGSHLYMENSMLVTESNARGDSSKNGRGDSGLTERGDSGKSYRSKVSPKSSKYSPKSSKYSPKSSPKGEFRKTQV